MSAEHRSNLIIAPYVDHDLLVTDLNHVAWDSADPIKIEHHWSGTEAPSPRHAEAAIVWTSKALNVRFVCSQQEPLIISSNPNTSSKTLGLWDRDVCEIFVAPNPREPLKYFEFEAAPTGEWVDLGLQITPHGRETDWDFTSGMAAAAALEGQTLTICIRIPWSLPLPEPRPADEWRVNLFRCVGPEAPERYLAWQPTGTPEPNFHVPEVFGYLQFA